MHSAARHATAQEQREADPAARSWPLALLLAAALIAGGGGVGAGLANLFVQAIALVLLAIFSDRALGFWRAAPSWLRWLLAMSLALPLLQLVPLPPSLWQNLPGRALPAQGFDAVGIAPGWRPISLEPARTLVAAAGLIVPLAIFVLGWRCGKRALIHTGWLVVAIAGVNIALGIAQVLSQGSAGLIYAENPMPGVLFGLFANRNSAGIFLACCLALSLLMPLPAQRGYGAWIRAMIAALLCAGILLTASRSAIVLAAIVLLLALAWHMRGRLRARLVLVLGLAIAAMLGAAIATTSGSAGRLGAIAARFAQTQDARAYLWEDSAFAAQRYWPLGSGMGTFDAVFQADESLEHLTERRAGRAHNDWLELAVEGGLVAILLALAWSLACGLATVQARGSPLSLAGALALALFALQSITDYPLRSQALLALAAYAFLLVLRGERSEQT